MYPDRREIIWNSLQPISFESEKRAFMCGWNNAMKDVQKNDWLLIINKIRSILWAGDNIANKINDVLSLVDEEGNCVDLKTLLERIK